MAPSCAAETGAVGDVLALAVEPAGELVDHPIGGELRVAGCAAARICHDRLEIFRGLALGDKHAGVVGRKVA